VTRPCPSSEGSRHGTATPHYVAQHLGAHHALDLFHVQHELRQAISVPMAAKQRAVDKALKTAEEQLKRAHEHPANANDKLAKRGPGRPPKVAPYGIARFPPIGPDRYHRVMFAFS
jgi:hypothetical protein